MRTSITELWLRLMLAVHWGRDRVASSQYRYRQEPRHTAEEGSGRSSIGGVKRGGDRSLLMIGQDQSSSRARDELLLSVPFLAVACGHRHMAGSHRHNRTSFQVRVPVLARSKISTEKREMARALSRVVLRYQLKNGSLRTSRTEAHRVTN